VHEIADRISSPAAGEGCFKVQLSPGNVILALWAAAMIMDLLLGPTQPLSRWFITFVQLSLEISVAIAKALCIDLIPTANLVSSPFLIYLFLYQS
jgi:hypothetical protein